MKFEIIYIIEKKINESTQEFENLILPICGANYQLLIDCINRYSCSSPETIVLDLQFRT